MPRGVCEARFMKVETKQKKFFEETRFLNDERKKAERALQELPLTYVDREAYNIEK